MALWECDLAVKKDVMREVLGDGADGLGYGDLEGGGHENHEALRTKAIRYEILEYKIRLIRSFTNRVDLLFHTGEMEMLCGIHGMVRHHTLRENNGREATGGEDGLDWPVFLEEGFDLSSIYRDGGEATTLNKSNVSLQIQRLAGGRCDYQIIQGDAMVGKPMEVKLTAANGDPVKVMNNANSKTKRDCVFPGKSELELHWQTVLSNDNDMVKPVDEASEKIFRSFLELDDGRMKELEKELEVIKRVIDQQHKLQKEQQQDMEIGREEADSYQRCAQLHHNKVEIIIRQTHLAQKSLHHYHCFLLCTEFYMKKLEKEETRLCGMADGASRRIRQIADVKLVEEVNRMFNAWVVKQSEEEAVRKLLQGEEEEQRERERGEREKEKAREKNRVKKLKKKKKKSPATEVLTDTPTETPTPAPASPVAPPPAPPCEVDEARKRQEELDAQFALELAMQETIDDDDDDDNDGWNTNEGKLSKEEKKVSGVAKIVFHFCRSNQTNPSLFFDPRSLNKKNTAQAKKKKVQEKTAKDEKAEAKKMKERALAAQKTAKIAKSTKTTTTTTTTTTSNVETRCAQVKDSGEFNAQKAELFLHRQLDDIDLNAAIFL